MLRMQTISQAALVLVAFVLALAFLGGHRPDRSGDVRGNQSVSVDDREHPTPAEIDRELGEGTGSESPERPEESDADGAAFLIGRSGLLAAQALVGLLAWRIDLPNGRDHTSELLRPPRAHC
jgi:hypothetical protein